MEWKSCVLLAMMDIILTPEELVQHVDLARLENSSPSLAPDTQILFVLHALLVLLMKQLLHLVLVMELRILLFVREQTLHALSLNVRLQIALQATHANNVMKDIT